MNVPPIAVELFPSSFHPPWIEVILFPSPKLNLCQNLPNLFPQINFKKTTKKTKPVSKPSDYPHTIPPQKKNKHHQTDPSGKGPNSIKVDTVRSNPGGGHDGRPDTWVGAAVGRARFRGLVNVTWAKPSLPVGLLNGEGAGKGDKSWAMFVNYGDTSPINGWWLKLKVHKLGLRLVSFEEGDCLICLVLVMWVVAWSLV